LKLTAIVSAYNSSIFIGGCIDNLLNQTIYSNGNLEIIVIDSGSEEKESKILSWYLDNYPNIKYISINERITLYKAWNLAIRKSSGKYITNANTDDRHKKDCLEILVNFLERSPNTDLVYGSLFKSLIQNETYEQNNKAMPCNSQDFFPGSLLLHDFTGAQPVWRKSIHDKIGLFEENYSVVGDYEFVLRLISNGCKLNYEPKGEGLMFWHRGSLSTKDSRSHVEKKALFDHYRSHENITKIYSNIDDKKTPIEDDIYLDLGVRALCFYPQFNNNHPSFDFEFAKRCFSFSNTSSVFIDNLKALEEIISCDNTISYNPNADCSKILFYGSEEKYPSECDLKGVTPHYIEKIGVKEIHGRKFQTYSFSVEKFYMLFFGDLSISELSKHKSIYVCGFNQRGKLVGNWISKKTSSKIVFIDANAKNLCYSNTHIINYDEVICSNEKTAFILAMSSHHWNSVIDRIHELSINASIYKLDHS
jgi:glycosyltransferase involved in cell wall biosynthesis